MPTPSTDYHCPNCGRICPCKDSSATRRAEPPVSDDPSIRFIPLTKGQYAIVDAEDYEWLVNMTNWHALWAPTTRSFYAASNRQHEGKSHHVYMARVILGLERGDKRCGDHINGNTLDHRRANLRAATRSQNACNRKRYRTSATGFKGVTIDKATGQYRASIRFEGKEYRLGYRATAEEAHALYCEASTQLHGEFGRTE